MEILDSNDLKAQILCLKYQLYNEGGVRYGKVKNNIWRERTKY